ncbi:BQ5605_C008g05192 [Microbotryum silenes-dioicae]|uniref:coproporphyrinogen oxidase n=1 Tax=Microbotryum silenes-dioicae TaxID=796604 RepID=A0A2X0MFT5_9BASI|nr:BQ5605_C008g05192 [Microbotryum silenes-dioicae]
MLACRCQARRSLAQAVRTRSHAPPTSSPSHHLTGRTISTSSPASALPSGFSSASSTSHSASSLAGRRNILGLSAATVAALSAAVVGSLLENSSKPLECKAAALDRSAHSDELPDELRKLGLSYDAKPPIDLDDTSIPMRDRMVAHIQSLQDNICNVLASLENDDPSSSATAGSESTEKKNFRSSYYLRDNNKGFGDSRVLQDGKTFEKAGCNISVIHSTLSVAAVKQMRAERFDWWDGKTELPYFVAGCSLVVHPVNPHAPTIHFNYRYFEIHDPNGDPNAPPKAWWFGGGTDITPSYLYEEDIQHFHGLHKQACDRHDKSYYPKFKKWCDTYFYIPFRGETRGFGGIFFDDLADGDDAQACFNFVRDCSKQFLRAYYPIMQRRKDQPYTEEEKRWQQLRRGRYVEFNMNIDRGVRFGLAMKQPRVESILMSLPLTARWEYETEMGTQEGSPEKKVLDILKEPIEWV